MLILLSPNLPCNIRIICRNLTFVVLDVRSFSDTRCASSGKKEKSVYSIAFIIALDATRLG